MILSPKISGFGSGVFELALAFPGDAFRLVYAVLLAPMCG
jgi:hypothetical protein